ncbi:MAG: DNA polymerase subunit beta [Candidatus Saganbacteria bacterium]|uniref:DNA polymerase subunit beta n=1 Tax=Candidatus Saganbacteria bacterium TaxID=2575572 RepID=A0A833L0Q9_UNCSA|nr:MAG: DNA polymerase subunit beta [Candidatus Saganbacteria bacterium]
MKYGLKEETINKINNIFAQYSQVEEAILYGSRAKGDFKKGSDIDITLKGKKLDLSLVNKISIEIDDLLLPYSFDLSILDQISSLDLLDHIKRRGIVFYSSKK